MKTTALIFAAAIALSSSAVAGDKTQDAAKTKPAPADKAKKTQAIAPEVEKNVAVTGSYIKRDVRRNGYVTDGSSPLYVLDNKAIQNTGAATLGELLIRRNLQR